MNKSDEPNVETLADYLKPNLRILSIGCNPSPLSVQHQCYFANPRNRFWKALNGSDLIEEVLQPNTTSMKILLDKYQIGFTDVVKRCTPGVSDLKAADYREDSLRLLEKIQTYQPKICWFHGKVAYKNFVKFTSAAKEDIEWGLQEKEIESSRVFVTPNPSPANAVYSLNDLVTWYQQLKELL